MQRYSSRAPDLKYRPGNVQYMSPLNTFFFQYQDQNDNFCGTLLCKIQSDHKINDERLQI